MPGRLFGPESDLTKVLLRNADMRIKKVKAEQEIIPYIGQDLTDDEKTEIERKRRDILYQLELEGAEIEREYVVAFRSRIGGLFENIADFGFTAAPTCHVACQICITSCTACVTSCSQCISSCPNCVTPCTNSVF